MGAHAVATMEAAQLLPPIESLLATLLNEVAALSTELVLVLDDYHVVESEPVHAGLAFLLEHLPPNLHVVIASRADPPLGLSTLRARGQLAEIRAADLRFMPDEAAAFLRLLWASNWRRKMSRRSNRAPRVGLRRSNSRPSRCRGETTLPGSSLRSPATTGISSITSWRKCCDVSPRK